jgi:hypothetical protein
MNKQGITPLTIIFWFGLYFFLWAVFFSKIINYWGEQAVINGSLTGIEAFMFANLNFFILLFSMVAMVALVKYTS